MAKRLAQRDAALLNGVLCHGLDYDDTHMTGIIHLTVSVLPTVLSLAGQRGASGADMLAAYIAGVETGARIASATRGGLHAHGFHPTAVVGAFASTLAAGRLLGLDAAQLVHAQGVALSMASGSLQFIEDGAWTKRMHPGWAAQAAITAATFAANGIQAPQAPYEGRYGFYRCYLGEAEHARIDLSLATAGLKADGSATQWEVENVAIKPFPMCHFVHASADAAIALHRQGIDPSRIRAVEVHVPAGVVQSVCEPVANKRRPTSDYDAKFSLVYAVASGLLRGRLGLKELTPEAFWRPRSAEPDGSHRIRRGCQDHIPASLHRRGPRHARRRRDGAASRAREPRSRRAPAVQRRGTRKVLRQRDASLFPQPRAGRMRPGALARQARERANA